MRVEPYGPRDAELVIIGEAPGTEEARVGQPFVGPSGKMVRDALIKLGVDPETVYWTNVVKEYKAGNPTPTIEEIKVALKELKVELAALPNKRWILCVGAEAKQAITGSKESILKTQGQLLTPRKDLEIALEKQTIMAVMHPAYVLRNNSPANNAMFLSVMGAYVAQAKPQVAEVVKHRTELFGMHMDVRASLDIEATPVPWWHEDFKLISAAVSFDGQTAYTFDLRNPDDLRALRLLSEEPDIKWVMHNGKYDRQALLSKGIDFNLTFDTMTAQYLIDPDQKKGLEFLSGIYLGLPPYKDVDYKNILDEDPAKIAQMNGIDAIRTFRLYSEIFKPKIAEDERVNRLFQFLMLPAINALAELELGGVPIDTGKLADLTERYEETYERQVENLRDQIGDPSFNPNSPIQVKRLFFEKLHLPVVKRTPKGAPSFDEESRLKLLSYHPLVQTFHEQVTTEQRLSTFLRPWADLERDGFLHTSYKPSHVVTGRLSSEKPNFQQVPRDPEFRQVFGGRPGKRIVELDYSQIELRIAAWISGEETMLEAYRNDEDLHTLTAERILGDASARQVGKVLNFGLLYGAGWKKLQEIAFNDYGIQLTQDQAQRYHAQFFNGYPRLRQWHTAQKARAKRDGYVDSAIGRRRYFQHISGMDPTRAAHDENAALNHPVQSLASDLMLFSLTKLHRELPKGARVIATIHDSVLLEVDDDQVDEVVQLAVVIMEKLVVADIKRKFGVDITVPLKVDYSIGSYWKEGT